MRKGVLAVAAFGCLSLSACQTTAERQAQQDVADNAACIGYGAKLGTPTYVKCRTDLQRNRAIEDIATRQQMDALWADPYPGSFYYGGGYYFGRRRF